MRQIKSLQSSTNLLIPKKPFGRCVREIAQEMKYDVPFTKEAMEAIQVAAEAFLTDMFKSMVVFVSLAFHLKLEQRCGNQSIWCACLSALFMFMCLALASNHMLLLCRLYCVCYTCKARYHQA